MNLTKPFRFLLCIAASLPFLGKEAQAETEDKTMVVYFGTYTRGNSRGIYMARLDLATGKVSDPQLAVETANPSFLALHPNRRFLYAVGELKRSDNQPTGAVSAFAIEAGTGKLTLLNQQPSNGSGPCHINVDAGGKFVLVANYGGGNASVLRIEPDGGLGETTAIARHSGSSVHPRRQNAPHAHSINLDPQNRFAFVADLGIDKVMIHRFDATSGTLTPNDPPAADVAPGAGPRHFAFHPSGRFAYVINELNCTVTGFSHDGAHGTLQEIQTVSSLPEGETVRAGYSTAEVQVHPSGKFLYGSNRGHDTIAVFEIDETSGRLRPVQHQPTLGKEPRHFGVDPTGQFLLAANQNSDSVAVFRIDRQTGRLTPTGQIIEVPVPVCVTFLETTW